MTAEELFRDFWWLMFPLFGLVMAAWGMASSEGRSKRVMDLIQSYVDQGKDPPAELLKLAADDVQYSNPNAPQTRQHSNAWSFVVFAALAAGFTTGWWLVREQDYAFAFLIVAVVMGVLAVGALFILLLGRK
ncbi:MAG: hypothetical protein ACREH4_03325 [Vitreimonas sp.]